MPPKDMPAYDRKRHAERKANGLCINCGKQPPVQNRVACKDCRATQGTAKSRLIKERKALGLCYRCGKHAPENGFKICSQCSADWRKHYHANECKKRYRHVRKAYGLALKCETFNAYGGCRCTCCGETHMEFLTLDHIDGNGRQHREEVKARGNHFYAWAKANKFPPGFRVLCMNCNFALGHCGYCPHQSKT